MFFFCKWFLVEEEAVEGEGSTPVMFGISLSRHKNRKIEQIKNRTGKIPASVWGVEKSIIKQPKWNLTHRNPETKQDFLQKMSGIR